MVENTRIMVNYEENLEYTVSRITKFRKENNWTIQELAYRSEIERSELSKIEKGKKNITYKTLCKVAAGLGVRLSDLVKQLDCHLFLRWDLKAINPYRHV